MSHEVMERAPHAVTDNDPTGSPVLKCSSQEPIGSIGVRDPQKKRVCFGGMAVEESVAELPRKRLRANKNFLMQVRFVSVRG